MTKHSYKKQGNVGLFDVEINAQKISKLGNPLERLSQVIDFEIFRPTLENGLFKK